MQSSSSRSRLSQLEAFDKYFNAPGSPFRLDGSGVGIPEAWFLGPKAENESVLLELALEAICKHSDFRRDFHPEDPAYITRDIRRSHEYIAAIQSLKCHASILFDELQKSVPFFSMRYQAHMLWDQALPAIVGYIGALLYNQNNVAAEASPLTTRLEIEVGNDLCKMLGYPVPSSWPPPAGQIVPWAHITCDGSVANIEAMWASRNAKFYALALREALRHDPRLKKARALQIRLLDGTSTTLIDVDDAWVLLNLKIDDVVSLPQTIKDTFKIDPSITNEALNAYSVQNIGLVDFYTTMLPSQVRAPVVLAPATKHYSWPKAATLLGLGQNQIKKIHVDPHARMNTEHLRSILTKCLQDNIPVVAVVAVVGSTEESAVDPLKDILAIRAEFRQSGLDFAIHCDAAWGGYFNSMRTVRSGKSAPRPPPSAMSTSTASRLAFLEEVPQFPMSEYVNVQYASLKDADSITVDPHKAGYVPYPAGAVSYRNSAMRDLISLKAPVIFHNQNEPTVGIYGVEGSKPGAAAAAVWLAHKVIPPNKHGYGKILAQCMWTSKRLYARLVTMDLRERRSRYKLVPLPMLPSEQAGHSPARERKYIARHFVSCTNEKLLQLLKHDHDARKLFAEMGSDQLILAYSVNFKERHSGKWNQDVEKINKLIDKIFSICSVTDPEVDVNLKNLIVTSSSFDLESYGDEFVKHYCRRLGVKSSGSPASISFLISTTMGPWPTDAPGGDFLAIVEESLRQAIHQALSQLNF